MSVTIYYLSSFDQCNLKNAMNFSVEFNSRIQLDGVTPLRYLDAPKAIIEFYNTNKGHSFHFLNLMEGLYGEFLRSPDAEVGFKIIKWLDSQRKNVNLICNPDAIFDYAQMINDVVKDHGVFTKVVGVQ